MGRPKGRRYYPYSINLTPEQREWMKSQPNSSQFVRDLVDQLMKSESSATSKVLGLKSVIEALEREYWKIHKEYDDYEHANAGSLYEEEFVEETHKPWKKFSRHRVENLAQTSEEQRLDMKCYARRPDISEYHAKILDAYEARIRSLDAEIAEKKRQFLSMPLQSPSEEPKEEACAPEAQPDKTHYT